MGIHDTACTIGSQSKLSQETFHLRTAFRLCGLLWFADDAVYEKAWLCIGASRRGNGQHDLNT